MNYRPIRLGLIALLLSALVFSVEAQNWWSGAADLGGVPLNSGPAAVTGGPHKIDIFYRGPSDHRWTSGWPGTPGGPRWVGPAGRGGVRIPSAPAAGTPGA